MMAMYQSRIQRPLLQYHNVPTQNVLKHKTGTGRLHPRHHRQTHHHFYLRRGPVIEPWRSRLCEIGSDNSGWRPWLMHLLTI